ncbi:MAG TPA: amino acid ABC transporter permease [Candidatus Fournierella merdipullorum]|uniref:Amino acid ABC transporter permease n=1 Tax=Candidatus Allofournierella merdipullorum TaxID=2838595 RepID=A0A9D2E5Y3_9FIRM|nr:amino acid ABC transporter permease [Candidatus Fournierella merdipullorum]
MGLLQSFFESDFWQIHIYTNFIAEDRWKYLTDGLKVTIIITLAALVIGIVLGALVAVVRVTHDKAGRPGLGLRLLNAVCQFYLTVIRGTPVMVQLLIMYFVVFATVDPGKLAVAIIAFGINSGAYVAEIFRSGIMSVDPGQMEAGRSLGLNYAQVMTRIIMPQAVKNILPTLNNEFIALVKETAVVGYIALGDLTRGGDQIRSQTWDAFPPLLAVALIYLAIVMLLEKLGKIVERRLAQSDRS